MAISRPGSLSAARAFPLRAIPGRFAPVRASGRMSMLVLPVLYYSDARHYCVIRELLLTNTINYFGMSAPCPVQPDRASQKYDELFAAVRKRKIR